MDKNLKIIYYGLIIWVVPFLAGFPLIDSQGNLLIEKEFFKTIMIVIATFTRVIMAVKYFKEVKENHLNEGILIGFCWLAINWGLDIIMVTSGFFPMTLSQYFKEIGLRYLAIPTYTIGLGYSIKNK